MTTPKRPTPAGSIRLAKPVRPVAPPPIAQKMPELGARTEAVPMPPSMPTPEQRRVTEKLPQREVARPMPVPPPAPAPAPEIKPEPLDLGPAPLSLEPELSFDPEPELGPEPDNESMN